MSTVRVDGVKLTIRELRRIDPELRRTFNRDVREILKPVIDEARRRYQSIEYPSGTARKWQQNGREKFPLTNKESVRGVGVKIDTRKRNASTIVVVQSNAGASIFEFANGGNLGASFKTKNGGTPRVIWPAADSRMPQVIDNMRDLVDRVADEISRSLD